MGTKAILRRLDRLTRDEARMNSVEILKAVCGLVQDMSKQMHSTCFLLAAEYSSF